MGKKRKKLSIKEKDACLNNMHLYNKMKVNIPVTKIIVEADINDLDSLNMLKEYIKVNQAKTPLSPQNLGNYTIHAAETVMLLMKLYPLYKDRYHEAEELLKFATCYLKSGVLNGLPAITSVDPDLEIIMEVLHYISEVKEDYFSVDYFRHVGYTYSRNFKDFFDEKDKKNMQLYSLFSNNIYKNSYDYKFFADTSHSLERMLDEYEKYRDDIMYKLENDKMSLSDLIDDPFLNLNTSIDTGYLVLVPNKKNRNKCKIYDYNQFGFGCLFDDNYSITLERYAKNRLEITSDTPILDFVIKASYIIPNLYFKCQYINEDGILKIYHFKNGELVKNYSNDRGRIAKAIYEYCKFRTVPECAELIETNLGKLNYLDYITILDYENREETEIEGIDILKYKLKDVCTKGVEDLYMILTYNNDLPCLYDEYPEYHYQNETLILLWIQHGLRDRYGIRRKNGLDLMDDINNNVDKEELFKKFSKPLFHNRAKKKKKLFKNK